MVALTSGRVKEHVPALLSARAADALEGYRAAFDSVLAEALIAEVRHAAE